MPILYNFKKEKDEFIIEAEQTTVCTLFYLSNGVDTQMSVLALEEGVETNLPITMDGEYKIILEVEGENSLEEFFTSFRFLQNSIIEDVEEILCGSNCIDCSNKKNNKECLKAQDFFVKALSFETLFVPSYGADFPLIFTNFLNNSIQSVTCKIQNKVNDILAEEYLRGKTSEKNVTNLSSFYAALYWAGMYFIEEELAEDEEQLLFIQEKFQYNSMLECLCGLCVDINTLKENYGKDSVANELYSFQFDGLDLDIEDADIITPEWLEINGTLESEDSLRAGKNITYTLLGRVGFVVTNNKDSYRFYNALGSDITDTVFDNTWDDIAKRQTYISKEYYVPSIIYYKFVKI